MTRRWLIPVALVACLAAGACGLDLEGLEAPDGSTGHDASADSSTVDVTTYDTGAPEGSLVDTVQSDTTQGDTTEEDVELADTGSTETGVLDAGDAGGVCPPNWQCIGGPIPAGWTLLELSTGPNPGPCDSNFSSPMAVYGGTFPPATCTCAGKVGTPGSCTGGNIDVSFGSPGCSMFDAGAPAGAGCATLPVALTPVANLQIEVTPAPYTPGTCAATPTTTVTPVTAAAQTCALAQPPGGEGCTNGQVCAPNTSGNYHHCIVAAGTQTCPPGLGYNNPQIMGQGYDDSRACSPCTTTGPTATCGNAALTYYTNPGCTQGAQAVQANSTCSNFPGPTGGGAPTYKAQEYTATVQNETCTATAGPPTGGVTLTGEFTVCCR